MGVLSPSMVKSTLIYFKNLPTDKISNSKRECALEALEKQVHKPVKIKKYRIADTDGCYGMFCPSCGGMVAALDLYCPTCGQRVDMEVKDAESN